ncbi:hypothetical protein QTP88_007940 [Uroleucon formosanum]
MKSSTISNKIIGMMVKNHSYTPVSTDDQYIGIFDENSPLECKYSRPRLTVFAINRAHSSKNLKLISYLVPYDTNSVTEAITSQPKPHTFYEVENDQQHTSYAQISQKSGRNLSSSSDVPSNKIVKTSEKSIFSSSNRYSLLTVDDNCEIGNPPQHSANEVPDEIIEPVKPPPSPPPIIVNGINDFVRLRSELIKLIGSENFLFKSSTNNLKIITKNSDSYRSVVKFLNDQGAEYHTYQQRENKAFRIIIRNIHPSTPTNEVGIAIQEIGFTVKQVVNVRHKITKLALPIFFVDLEPAEINKDVFHVTHILHTKIKIEEPHKRRELVQCFNCQKYGHSKTYCSHPPRCVGRAANHPSSSCNKTKDQPPTCALCCGNHPANYRGCTVHKDLQKLKNGLKTTIKYNVKEGKASADKIPSDPPSFNLNDDKMFPNLAQMHPQNLPKSSNPNPNWHTHNTPPENNLTSQLSSFITELKSVINPLIQLLTTVINQLILKKDK